jgi:phage I-like protein
MAGEKIKGPGLPEWIRVLPRGRVELADGRDAVEVDETALQAMVAAFKSRGVDLVVDYEHQSLKGERAPAAGWIKELEAREDGLWARVEWTGTAEEYLKNREYRYFSPVLKLDPATRRPLALMQVALTNVPAIMRLTPLVAKAGEGRPNGREEIHPAGLPAEVEAALGLAPGADQAAALQCIAALKQEADTARELEDRVKELTLALKAREAREQVESALKEGKVTPAQRLWAEEFAGQDLEGFKAFVSRAPQVVPVGESLKLTEGEANPLTEAERQVWQALGLNPGTGKLRSQE